MRGAKPLPVHSRGPLVGLSVAEAAALDTLEAACLKAAHHNPPPFEFDRKFLFKVTKSDEDLKKSNTEAHPNHHQL